MATRIATPSTAPIWRVVALIPLPIPSCDGPRSRTQTATIVAKPEPDPDAHEQRRRAATRRGTPARTRPGSPATRRDAALITAPGRMNRRGSTRSVKRAGDDRRRPARQRTGRDREAGAQHRVVPDLRQVERVRQHQPEEAGAEQQRADVAGAERAPAEQRELEHRRRMPGAAPDQQRREQRGRHERPDRARIAPAPHGTLHRAERERADRGDREHRAEQVGTARARTPRRRRHPPAEHERGESDREVDEEHEPPAGRGRP